MELILMAIQKTSDLTANERIGIAQAAKYELARRNYADFFLLANKNNQPAPKLYDYTKYICDRLQEIIDGKQKHIILELPPQHGKSMAVTETFPAYYLMRNPNDSVIVTSYAEDMYTRFAKKGRMHFTDWANVLFGLHVGKNTQNIFDVAEHTGEAYYTSIHGGGTGRPANLLIIDDPIKDASEARSKTVKDNIWDEWATTFSTRLQKNASVIVIMTRWQDDDLAGRLLKQKAFDWEEIKFPAIATENDILGREYGEALNPELHPVEQLLQQKANIGSQKFEALYQQSPTIDGGNIFKREWIKYYVPTREMQVKLGLTDNEAVVLPRHLHDTVQAWDATFKSKENDDFVAGQTWSRRDANVYLRPNWCHKRLSFTETLDAIKSMSRTYPEATAKLIEDKANGPAIIDTLRRTLPGIMPVSPGADSKEARAASVSPYFEAGQVYVPHPLWVPAVEDMIEEWVGFPNMAHDDSVDAMVYAVRRLLKRNGKAGIRFR